MKVIRVNISESYLVFHSVKVWSYLIDCIQECLTSEKVSLALEVPRITPPGHNLKLKLLTNVNIAEFIVTEERR